MWILLYKLFRIRPTPRGQTVTQCAEEMVSVKMDEHHVTYRQRAGVRKGKRWWTWGKVNGGERRKRDSDVSLNYRLFLVISSRRFWSFCILVVDVPGLGWWGGGRSPSSSRCSGGGGGFAPANQRKPPPPEKHGFTEFFFHWKGECRVIHSLQIQTEYP